MDNFTFYSPTYFAFGKGTENDTGAYVKKYGGTKVLIHYGGGSAKRSGLLDRVEASLAKEGIEYVEFGGVKASPLSDLVYEGIDLARKEKVDFILAVGGGSVMDSAKGIALGAVRKAPPTRLSPSLPRTATSTSAAQTATSCARSSPS